MRRGALVLVSLLLGASALSASAATEQNPLVIQGRSIGKVSLGMTVAQVRKAVGRPSQVERESLSPSRFLWTYSYEARQLSIVFYGTRASSGRPATKARVTRIETTSEGARLANGIGVGTLERQLMRAYRGRLDCPRWKTSPVTDEAGHVVRIGMAELRACYLRAPGSNTLTVFVSQIPPQGYRGFGLIEPSDIPKARVWEIIVRLAA
jgi:outer membrane protein assembly factor BamE (lipoprotein component of BamABCDE complex)